MCQSNKRVGERSRGGTRLAPESGDGCDTIWRLGERRRAQLWMCIVAIRWLSLLSGSQPFQVCCNIAAPNRGTCLGSSNLKSPLLQIFSSQAPAASQQTAQPDPS